jgi:hypothetical protein
MVFEEARPELLTFKISHLAGNDALDASAGAELGVGMRSRVEVPRGRGVAPPHETFAPHTPPSSPAGLLGRLWTATPFRTR